MKKESLCLYLLGFALVFGGCKNIDVQYSSKIDQKSKSASCGHTLRHDQISASNGIEGIKFPNGYNLSGLNFSGLNIKDIDFSNTQGLLPENFNKAQLAAGNKFPDGFDISGVSFNMSKEIWGSDLSNVSNLSLAQLEGGSNQKHGLVFSQGFDLSSWDTTGLNISNTDYRHVDGLNVSHLENADLATHIKLPSSLDISAWDTSGNDLTGVDFSLVSGVSAFHFNNSLDFTGAVFPENFDCSNLNAGQDLSHIDASQTNITTDVLNAASSFQGIKLPSSFDWTGLSPAGKNLKGINFSGTVNLTKTMLENSGSDLRGIVLPSDIDMAEANLSGKDLRNADLTGAENLTPAQLEASDNYRGVRLSPFFDVSSWVTDDKYLSGVDFRGTEGLTVEKLNKSSALSEVAGGDSYYAIVLPEYFNISALDTLGKAIDGIDFSKTIGLEPKHINEALTIRQIKFPDGFDVSSLSFVGKDISGIDFSNTTGLSAKQINAASNIEGIKLPAGMDLREANFSGKSLSRIDFSKILNTCDP